MNPGVMQAKLSSKNQIVVPKDAREALGIKAGDQMLVVVRGQSVILLPKPGNYSQALRGAGKGIYSSDYLKKERESW